LEHVDHVVFVLNDLLFAFRLAKGLQVFARFKLCLLQLFLQLVLLLFLGQ
jgi:hypothetical protein